MKKLANDETYHVRIKEEKRAAAVSAAMELFLEQGYDRTSLQQVAKRADVSTATLFKRFPTKAALFEAIVEQFWEVAQICEGPPKIGDPARGLRKVGLGYARRMRQPEMAAIYRLIIAEALRFPDLGRMLHDKGKAPLLAGLEAYLAAEVRAGTLLIADAEMPKVSRAFFAVIAGQAFWPELLVPGCGGTEEQMKAVVEGAIELIIARYGRR